MNRSLTIRDEIPRFPSVFSSRLWDDLWGGLFNENHVIDDALFAGASSTPCDVIQTKDADGNVTGTEFSFALAGFGPEDVSVEVDENELTIKVNKSEETKEDDSKIYVHRGLARRSMQFSYVLAGQVDKENISACFDKGVLKVNLPVLPKKEIKKIEIKSAGQLVEAKAETKA